MAEQHMDQTRRVAVKRWEDMTREELNYHFSPSQWSHRFGPDEAVQDHINACTTGSDQARAKMSFQEAVPFGSAEREKMDIFLPDGLADDAFIFVYIHGGYWRRLSRQQSSYMALSLVPAGAGVIALGYTLAPHAKMDQIVAEIRRGVLAALQLAYKRNSRGVFLSGHSAGAHLTAMALADDELRNQPHLANLIKGVVFVSGIYDLRPLVNTDINDTVQMTTDDAWRNSPINCIEPISENCRGASVLVTLGQHDPPMFHEQSTQFNQELEDRGVQVKYLVVQNTDHFNVMDQLQDPNHAVTKEVKHMMGLH